MIWIRKCFRLNENPLLIPEIPILLSSANYEFNNSPFTDEGNYQKHYQQQRDLFAEKLKRNGFAVVIGDPEDYQNKILMTDELSDSLGRRRDKNFHLRPLPHLNTLLKGDIIPKLKPCIGFSKFRKIFEKAAFSINQVNHDVESLHFKKFQTYLSTGAATSYFETRNQFCGDKFSTRLSDSLNLGQLAPQQIVQMVNQYEKEQGANKSTYWIKFELLWREYFYWLYQMHQEDFFRSDGLKGGDLGLKPMDIEEYLTKMNTHPLIQAMNRELMETGFLSNRTRQIYVSYLIFHTDLDWRYGAWFFQHYLKDYDVFSNWGNWLYGSGHGTDSRGPRYFKIEKQLKQYDPAGDYLKIWG